MKICAHILVKNEAKFIWYSVSSIIDFVDTVLIFDTGSNDKTVEIIKILQNKYPNKIIFKSVISSFFDEQKARQQLLDETDADWFITVDADEIWWEDSIKKVVDTIKTKGNEIESIVTPTEVPIGDMFHRQEKSAGRYKLAGHIGHFALRAVNRNIPGLSSSGAHGVWGWVDKEGKMIQDRDSSKIYFVDFPYMHVTHLQRAGDGKDFMVEKRRIKLKHEIGNPFPKDYYYPEVFFKPRPDIVECPWKVMDAKFKLISYLETPLRKLKRRLLWGRVGY